MKFSSMIIKNIKHNIKNYMAFLFGTSIIQSILFMFFTLIFSPEFMEADKTEPIKGNLEEIVALMLAFSLCFIVFTAVSFTKYRGKEFGVYFTIGLTTRDVVKILIYENIIISIISFIIASIGGSVFSKLFHMSIGKILNISNLDIPLSLKAYGAIALISIGIFLFTILFQVIFLNRYSVVEILKSNTKKDVGRTGLILGTIGIIIFVLSIIAFKRAFKENVLNSQYLLGGSIIGAIISTYLIIGFSITLVVSILKRFKKLYNNNILFINSLSHRFISYRSVLYVVTLMVAGGVFFISISYGMYKATERQNSLKYPYDLSFVVKGDKLEEVDSFIYENLENTKLINKVEGLNIPDIKVYDGDCLWRNSTVLTISEDSYKGLVNKSLGLKRGEVKNFSTEKMGMFAEAGVMIDLSNSPMKERNVEVEKYKSERNEGEYIEIQSENVDNQVDSIINTSYSSEFPRMNLLVVSNEDYNYIKEKLGDGKVTYDILINLGESEIKKDFDTQLENVFGPKARRTLTIKEVELNSAIQENSFNFFTFSFMGLMFLVGSAAVLYFKAMTLVDEDRERAEQLVRLGLSKKDIQALSMKELGVIFLVPPVVAMTCIGYYLSSVYQIINDGEYMWENTMFVFIVYSIIQIIFYLLTYSKYKKQIRI